MKTALLLLACSFLFFGCESICPQEEWSTVPSTNNPHLIVDPNRRSGLPSTH